MHLRRLWIALGLFAAFAASAAVVYKWTDADGVVHYSDQAVPGAEKIITSSGSANGIGGSTRGPANTTPNKAAPPGLDYSGLAIESPAKEQVFFGDEIVPVRLHLEPNLKPNQTITWHLNGKQLTDQPPDATGFALQGLARGTYAVAATVTDLVSGESQSTDSVTFYVRQPSELSPQHKRP
jgi:hypothetical protein